MHRVCDRRANVTNGALLEHLMIILWKRSSVTGIPHLFSLVRVFKISATSLKYIVKLL